MKTVVITGSTRGIGLGLARQLLLRGSNVVLNGTSRSGVDNAMRELARFEERLIGVVADVASRADMERLLAEARKKFSRVDIWINNAGIVQPQRKVWELDESFLDHIIAVNIKGVVNGMAVAFPAMEKQGGGRIFNMEGLGSDGFIIGNMGLYGMTKSALSYVTKVSALESRGSRVNIGALSPGIVMTDMLETTVSGDEADRKRKSSFYNLMADDVETVTSFLAEEILKERWPGGRITWLTKRKMLWRFTIGRFRKRKFFQG